MMAAVVAVFIGGAIGGVCRWGLTRAIRVPRVGTWAANMAASSVLGFVFTAPELWQLAAGVGFSGALSTFSTLAKETGELIKAKDYLRAAGYVLATAAVGIVSAAFGMGYGRHAFG